jgi:hypothetical protein
MLPRHCFVTSMIKAFPPLAATIGSDDRDE